MLTRPHRDQLPLAVGSWVTETFPKATATSIVAHLREETGEPGGAAHSDRDEEAADCRLLLTLAHHDRFGLLDAAQAKHGVHLTRSWEPAAGDKGYRKHVDATDD